MEQTKGSLILVSIFGVLALCGISPADDPAGKPAPLFCAVGWRGEFTLVRPGVGELPPKRYDLPTHLQALAWSPDGVLYAGREGDLYTLNPWTGDFEHAVSITSDIRGMAFAPSGELYVTSEYTLAQRLRIIDLETGAHREAGVLWGDGQTAQGLTFSPDGVLYAISPKVHVGTYELFTIDLNDAEMHLLGSFSSSANANQSIAFTPDGRLYALGADVLVQLNPTDGTIIGSPTRLSGEYRGLELVRGPKTIYYVDDDAPGANNGSSWNNAFNNLQDALTAAEAYTEIRAAQGIYKPDLGAGITPGDRTATFQMKNNVTIKGSYAGCGQPEPNERDIELYETILSGDLNGDDAPDFANNAENSYHVVTGSATDETAVLDGFTVTAGNASGIYSDANSIGGGMYSDSGSPTVTRCAFTLNAATCAGGMANWQNSNPTVSNCTFMENWGRSFGGMWNSHSHPTVTGCAFDRNASASSGAGMQNTHSDPTVTDCTFNANSTGEHGYGGGMHNMWSHPAVTGCTFANNSAPRGAGMRNHQGSSPIVANCTFTGNAADYGGGMANDNDCRPTIVNCTFTDNSADCEGGGMYNHDNITTVTNCLFRTNTANKYGGGGMYNSSSNLTITNCTFVENMAHNYGGGGMYNHGWGATTVMLNNCIFWANLADTGPQIMITRGKHAPESATVTVHYSDFQGGTEGIYVAYPDCHLYWGEGNIDVGPLFIDSADGDYHLLPGSPCIDAGDPDYVAEPDETDLDGRPRVIGGRIDMGAYEFNHIPVADAGPDETAYAGADGMAKVTLDGAGSYDEDEQPLTYKWSLKTDGEIVPLPGDGIVNLRDFAALAKKWRGLKKLLGETTPPYGHRQAVLADLSALSDLWLSTASSPKWNPEYDIAQTGPTPTIELPVGVHVIELVVNDGINDSLPDQVVITVVGPIEGYLKIVPQTINRHSQDRHIWAHIRLPAGITEDQIDISEPLLLYPGSIAASNQRATRSHSQADVRTSIFALFDKAALMDAVTDDGPLELQVVGRLMTGQYFYGCDTVNVIHAP